MFETVEIDLLGAGWRLRVSVGREIAGDGEMYLPKAASRWLETAEMDLPRAGQEMAGQLPLSTRKTFPHPLHMTGAKTLAQPTQLI